MSRLETVLRRAIVGLDPSDREGRRIALGNVRGSMVRLLAVYDPPLSAAEIEGKIDEIDALIRAIEAEFAPPRPGARPPAPPEADPHVADDGEADEADYAEDGAFDETYDEDDPDAPLEPGDEAGGLATGSPPRRRIGLVIAALIALAILLVGLFYLTREMRAAATPPAVAAAPGPSAGEPEPQAAAPPQAAAEDQGTDALEASDVPAEPAPAASPAVAPSSPAAAPAAAATPLDAEAVAPPPGPKATESLVLFNGHDPAGFKSTTDNPVRFEGGTDGGFVQLSSASGSNGARLVVGPGVYQRIAGRTIRIVVVARGAPDNPASTLRLAYQNGRQLSGWSDEELSDQFQSLAMDWAVPKERSGPENDAVLIEPGIPGDQTAADIRSVTIDILP